MSLFAISDLHLSLSENKKMDIFKGWENYVSRLEKNWNAVVSHEDTVVIAGDISWAMKLERTKSDFTFLNSLHGKKIIVKGNHDLWWETMTKMNAFFQENRFDTIKILHNNAFLFDDFAVCGTRGWFFEEGGEDEKILCREASRLETSLKVAAEAGTEPIAFLHYPPLYAGHSCEVIISILKKYNVKRCFYGHIHGSGVHRAFGGEADGIIYRLISCDTNDFTPVLVKKF